MFFGTTLTLCLLQMIKNKNKDIAWTLNWLNRYAESRALSIKVGMQIHLYEVI